MSITLAKLTPYFAAHHSTDSKATNTALKEAKSLLKF
jgi:hypothetical protein